MGRIDINTEVSMFAFHLELLREGHLEAVSNIVSYLWGKHNYNLALYPTYPDIDYDSFKNHKWFDFYGNVKEAIPPNIQEPRGEDIDLRMYVDRNNARDKSKLRPRKELIIYMHMALIQWLSKKKQQLKCQFLVRSLWQ